MKKIIEEVHGLIWTLAGTGLVLITLSGETQALGWGISIIALVTHLLLSALKNDS